MSQPLKHASPLLPMIVSLAAASLLLLQREARARGANVRRQALRRRGAACPACPSGPIDFATMRRRLLGLAPSNVTALIGPPRATVVGGPDDAADDTWYYPLGRSVAGAMAIRFDHSHHATAVTFVPSST